MTLMDPIGLDPNASAGWFESWPGSGFCFHQVRLWILTGPVACYQDNWTNFKEIIMCRKEMQTVTLQSLNASPW